MLDLDLKPTDPMAEAVFEGVKDQDGSSLIDNSKSGLQEQVSSSMIDLEATNKNDSEFDPTYRGVYDLMMIDKLKEKEENE